MRTLLTLGLGASALVLSPGSAPAQAATCPGGEAYLDVHLRGTVTADRRVCVAEIDAWHDLTEPPYRTRSIPGRDPQNDPNPHEALSIRWLATQLAGEIGGFSADSITFAEVPNPHSTYVSRLRAADLSEAGHNGFEDGLMPAVYFAPGFGLWYIRPLRPNPQDTNNRDWIAGVQDGPLDLYLHTSGQPLEPTIQVDRASRRVGQSSRFSATFDPPVAESLDYAWTFGDGTTGTAATPAHRWTTEGTFQIYLTVARPGQLSFQSNILQVEVGPQREQPEDPEDQPGGDGHGGPHNPETGPDDSSGHQAGTTPDPDGGQEPGAGGQDERPGRTQGADPDPEPDGGADAQPTDDGAVTGLLLTGADVQVAEAGAPVTAPAASAGSDRAMRLPAWLALVGGGLLLLALGGLSEARWVRRSRRPDPRAGGGR